MNFEIEREQDRDGNFWFTVTGPKPERWVRQTNSLDNEEAVGYLADRLARLGVEDALRAKGARVGDEVRIGRGENAMAFDWDPTVQAGAEMLDGDPHAQRGRAICVWMRSARSQLSSYKCGTSPSLPRVDGRQNSCA